MKKVLVPLQIFKDNPQFPTDAMEHIYTKKLIKYNLLPLFVSSVMSKEGIKELYDMSDALFLAGGEDWEPALYGQEKHPKTEVKEAERDIVELPLIKQAIKDRKPILAVCRGAEGLAIADGGSLIQHIPDKFTEKHVDVKISYYDLPNAKKHAVILNKKSNIYKLLKKEKIMVNSYHHQCIDNPGLHFKIVGRSPGGVAELIEYKDPTYFCIGIQSHPEMEEKSFVEEIFQKFAEVIYATVPVLPQTHSISSQLSRRGEYLLNSTKI